VVPPPVPAQRILRLRSWFPTRREELDPIEPPALARLEPLQPEQFQVVQVLAQASRLAQAGPGPDVLLHTGIDAFT